MRLDCAQASGVLRERTRRPVLRSPSSKQRRRQLGRAGVLDVDLDSGGLAELSG